MYRYIHICKALEPLRRQAPVELHVPDEEPVPW